MRQITLPGAAFLASVFWQGCLFDTHTGPPAILFIGNSITRHDPLPEVGWNQKIGMAATALDSDYVHRTIWHLQAKGIGARVAYGHRDCDDCDNIGAYEEFRGNVAYDLDETQPRWVVVQLGENLTDIGPGGESIAQYRRLLEELRKGGSFPIFCLTTWNETTLSGPQNLAIYRAMHGLPEVYLVDITSVAANSANYGDSLVYADPGVLWHPGNRGMDAIAAILADSLAAHP